MCDQNKAGCCPGGSNTMGCNTAMGMKCGGGHHHMFKLLKLLITLLVLSLVFSMGVHLGELKGYIQAKGGFEGYGLKMMGGWQQNAVTPAPAAK